VLELKSASTATTIFDFDSTSLTPLNLLIANMTLRGPKAVGGIRLKSARRCILANLVIHDMTGDAVCIESVDGENRDAAFLGAEGVYIENNTIVNCRRGITVERVPKSQNARAGFRSDGKLEFHPSRVENNIVVFGHALGEGAAHGIRIGSSSGDADQQCLAWNPFTNPFGDDPDQTGNPWVPVKYNWVWREGASTGAFVGADWYFSGYGGASNRQYDEIYANPGLTPDFRLLPSSPGKRAGNSYKIDLIKQDGKWMGMRRSVGAFESQESSDYTVLLN
jgi:hypothetical protein